MGLLTLLVHTVHTPAHLVMRGALRCCRHFSSSPRVRSQVLDAAKRPNQSANVVKYSEHHVLYSISSGDQPCTLCLDGQRRLEVGLTQRGLQEMGDVESIEGPSTPAYLVKAGDTLISMDWSGFKITEADELYHTVWENVEGVKRIALPVDAHILEWNQKLLRDFDAIETENWIVRVAVSAVDAESLIRDHSLMDEGEYRALGTEAVAPHYGA